MGKVFFISSGKGGVGKSTVSANLAAALAKNKTVLVIDADFEMANLDLMFGCRDSHVYDVQDLYCGRCAPEAALFFVPDHPGLTALFAPLHCEVPVDSLLRYVRRCVDVYRQRFDFILVDCPSGVGNIPQIFSDPRYEALIVATPDLTSVSDGERMAACFDRAGIGRIRLIVNRVRPTLIRKGLAPDIDTIIDSTSLQLIGLIPEDLSVIRGGNSGVLAYDLPRSRVRIPFSNIALRLQGQTPPLTHFS